MPPITTPYEAEVALLRQRLAARRSRSGVLKSYRFRPDLFSDRAFAWSGEQRLSAYQRDILHDFCTNRRTAIRAPHSTGKTTVAAHLIIWFAETRNAWCQETGGDWKIVTTASAWRQLSHYLWPEIHKWVRRLNWAHLGRQPYAVNAELLNLSIKLSHGEAFAATSNEPAKIEGAHADHLLFVFDEAKAIPDVLFDAAEGAFMGAGTDTASEAYALCISTPGPTSGRFYLIHKRHPGHRDWTVRHVTVDEAVAAGRISQEAVDQAAKRWGTKSAVFQNRVLGEFAAQDEEAVIPLSWVEAAVERWHEAMDAGPKSFPPLDTIGVDVGRSGEDNTVLAGRVGDWCTEIERFSKQDTMETVGHVLRWMGVAGGVPIVDVNGVGAGVVDRLRELGHDVFAFNAGSGAYVIDPFSKRRQEIRDRSGAMGFINLRSAAWWVMRELLDPAFHSTVKLPPDDELIGDLTAPKWEPTSEGRIKLESKDDIRERIGRSTDTGDAVVQAFAGHLLGGAAVSPLAMA